MKKINEKKLNQKNVIFLDLQNLEKFYFNSEHSFIKKKTNIILQKFIIIRYAVRYVRINTSTIRLKLKK